MVVSFSRGEGVIMSRCAVCGQEVSEGANAFWDNTRMKQLFRHDNCEQNNYKKKADMEVMSEKERKDWVKKKS
jgi:hypothetical protein